MEVVRSCAWKSNQLINFLSGLFIFLFVRLLAREISQIADLEPHYRFTLEQDPDNSVVTWV